MKKKTTYISSIIGISLILLIFLFAFIQGANPDRIIYHHIQMYSGDFDYSIGDTIYFKDESGYGARRYSDGHWEYGGSYMNPYQYMPSFTLDGYNFSVLNQDARDVSIYIFDNRSNDEWNAELDRVVLNFYTGERIVYYANELEVK